MGSPDDLARTADLHFAKALRYCDQPARMAALVRGMRSYGTHGEVLLRCAQIVRYTSLADSAALLAPHLDEVPDGCRGLVLEHAAALLDAADLVRTPVPMEQVQQTAETAIAALGADLPWLVAVMARAAAPVADSCGGPEHLARVGGLVEAADRRGGIVYPECAAGVMFALAALSAGNQDTAADCFAAAGAVAPVMATVAGIAAALLPPHARVASVLRLEPDGVPDAVTAADSSPVLRAAAALIEARNGPDAVAAARQATAGLTDADRVNTTLVLAKTLAAYVLTPRAAGSAGRPASS